MNTPILDFLTEYASREDTARLHMPGHKGRPYLGVERLDVTEISGADNLYYPEGVIAESEAVATALFGTQRTVYSTGGSSQSIMATMWLLRRYAADAEKAPLLLAVRNVHQAFVSAVAQTGLSVDWFYPPEATDIACPVDPTALESRLRGMATKPVAIYLTSPDYPGNLQPIAQIARVCHRLGVLLVVDNAHGAYLKFLTESLHPIDLGADIVCDSAHKTLPALTGAGYLHFGKNCPVYFANHAKEAMLTVGSTSPSYLIMASLDRVNATVGTPEYRERLSAVAGLVADAKRRLQTAGWTLLGDEPLKLSLYLRGEHGSMTREIADMFSAHRIVPEYLDDYLILMASADTKVEHVERAVGCLLSLTPPKTGVPNYLPPQPPMASGIREAYLAPRETLPIARCAGRTLAYLPVKCPPAVPAVIAGEVLTEDVLAYLVGCGYRELAVVR